MGYWSPESSSLVKAPPAAGTASCCRWISWILEGLLLLWVSWCGKLEGAVSVGPASSPRVGFHQARSWVESPVLDKRFRLNLSHALVWRTAG